jgi:hypothetical protein
MAARAISMISSGPDRLALIVVDVCFWISITKSCSAAFNHELPGAFVPIWIVRRSSWRPSAEPVTTSAHAD